MNLLQDPLPVPRAKGPVNARVVLPGSKSYTNRVLPIAALAGGTSTIRGVLDSDDTRFMVEALIALGFEVDADWEHETVRVVGGGGAIPTTTADLFLGNSGTSIRFLTALCALGHGTYTLDGVDRMRERPIGPLVEGLRQLGTEIDYLGQPGHPPIRLRANGIPGGTVTMAGNLSSQYFTALAMIAPYAATQLEIVVDGELVSKPYLDITASAMRAFGVELRSDGYQHFNVTAGEHYAATDYQVEPDASSASYFFALAATTGGEITVAGLAPDSAQGDLRFVDVLEEMGCKVTRNSEVSVQGPEVLRGVDVDMHDISDTAMTLAAIAPLASSPTTIRNVANIRLKETDRIRAVATELRRMTIEVEELEDGLVIEPGSPRAATIQTYDDHRIAMAFGILAAKTGSISISDPGCVSKTVPNFWQILLPLLD